jgi:hypothetical protein
MFLPYGVKDGSGRNCPIKEIHLMEHALGVASGSLLQASGLVY